MADRALLARALLGLGSLVAVMALVVFVGGGTLRYWEAWLFLGVFTTITLAITIDLSARDPELLARRMRAGPSAEPDPRQKLIQTIASAAFLACLLVPALDHRFHGSRLPFAVPLAGEVLVAGGLAIVFLAFRENSFAAATIELAEAQRVIETGPYAIVRHPMYSGGVAFVLGIPLALGSAWGLLAVVPLSAAIVWRLLDEEAFLRRRLPGYPVYCARTRYRLVPRIW